MNAVADLGARLNAAFDPRHVAVGREELETYTIEGLSPAAIVRPSSAAEAVEVVRFALTERLALLPLGSRSKCDMGLPPERYDIALDMTCLKEIAHFDARDLTLSVDAGVSLRELEGFLGKEAQFLPLAVPCFESATAGGTIASGIDSALRLPYGSARDFLLGAEFIDGTGRLCKSGGRVVKNVTGYDLHKLLIGSLGTLGVITRLNFRTFPLPATSAGHLASFASMEEALQFRRSTRKAGLPMANAEALSPELGGMLNAILLRAGETFPPELRENRWCVYSSVEGSEGVIRRIVRDLERISEENGAQQSRTLGTAEDNVLGGMLREAFEWLRWASPANIVCRLSLPRIDSKLFTELSQLAERLGVRHAVVVRAGGIIYFVALADEGNEQSLEALTKVATAAFSASGGASGHCSLLHAPVAVKENIAQAKLSQIDRGMQIRVKQSFDPSGVFAPGRVVGAV